jgi:hypothetical protein
MMHVLLSHSKFAGSRYYRMEEPARAVDEAGLGVTTELRYGLPTTMSGPAEFSSSEVLTVDAGEADVVVLQLPKTRASLGMVRALQAQGVAVVVELDDLLSGIAYGHMGYRALKGANVDKWARACALEADFVTVSSPLLLAEYAPHGRGMVVPNAMPRRLVELPPAYEREPDVVTVGWTGSVGSHPYDLQVMESGLQRALDEHPGRSRFAVIGQAADAKQRLFLKEEPLQVSWIQGVDDYVASIGDVLDIGVAPLRIDRFNTAKSWLKVMEYSGRGVYSVRSPSAEYERLGLGMRAKRPRDWATYLSRGIGDADFRRETAAAARDEVLAKHLTEHTAELWATAWRRAAENRVLSQRIGA